MKKMTLTEWHKIHEDYKIIINGQMYVLELVPHTGTCLVPIEIE